MDEIKETVEYLKRRIIEERTKPGVNTEDLHSLVKDICYDLLNTARVEDLGGCPLCQS
jgi:hypothetical protein